MTTSTRYPTTNAAGATGFTNASDAYSSNDSYATAAPGTLNTISSYFGGFDFASYIPSGATINSVTVYCERKFSTTASSASSTLRPYNATTALASENENTSEPTTDTVYSVNFGALAVADVRSADFRILVGAKRGSGSTGYTYSLDVVYVVVDYTAGAYTLTCDYASITVTGQDVTLTYTPASGYTLACDYASLTVTGQNVTLTFTAAPLTLTCDYAAILITAQSVTLSYTLWEPDTDMITFGTLLTRIQHALGDPNSATWDRDTIIWNFAVDAIRAFPILRLKTVVQVVDTAGHSFTLPSDFRKIIYAEYPPYQDPPDYLMRKSHLDAYFFGEDGYYDVDRDYDSGEDYLLWVSNDLAVDDVVIVRYLATHQTDFANEYAYVTIENQYIQVIVNHVVLMCFQERLAIQLQDPSAFTSVIAQLSDAVKSAEAVYITSLKRAEESVSSSQRVSGWKVDKHDRIY